MQSKYDFILSVVQEAGQRIIVAQEKGFEVSSKGNDSRNLVTETDIEINKFIQDKIKENFPEDEIYSEESDSSISGGSFWTIDPIDGTSNFARGIPHFATVLAFVENGEAVAGAIYNPVTRELFSFDKNKGAFLNKKPIKVSSTRKLSDAYVLLHIGRKENIREWGLDLQKKLLSSAKKNINLGSSALDLAFLASGRVDAVIYGTMTTMDIAVATALVRSAGGEVYGLEGDPIKLSKEPQQIIGTATPELFREIASA